MWSRALFASLGCLDVLARELRILTHNQATDPGHPCFFTRLAFTADACRLGRPPLQRRCVTGRDPQRILSEPKTLDGPSTGLWAVKACLSLWPIAIQ